MKDIKSSEQLINKLKESDLSPFEQCLVAHDYLKENNFVDAESITSQMYAEELDKILGELGIVCFVLPELISVQNGEYQLMYSNIVCLKDEKYNIQGIYHSQVCLDASNLYTNLNKVYSNTLTPISDFKNCNLRPIPLDDFSMLYFDKHDYRYFIDGPEYKSLFGITESGELSPLIKYLKVENIYEESLNEAISLFDELKEQTIDGLLSKLINLKCPKDLYKKVGKIEYGHSIEYFLTRLMFSENLLDFDIDLQEMISNVQTEYFRDRLSLNFEYYIEDLYDYLLKLKNSDAKSGIAKPFIYMIRKGLLFNYVNGKLKIMIDHKKGKPISHNQFVEALHKAYEFEGIETSEIDNVIDTCLEESKRILRFLFPDYIRLKNGLVSEVEDDPKTTFECHIDVKNIDDIDMPDDMYTMEVLYCLDFDKYESKDIEPIIEKLDEVKAAGFDAYICIQAENKNFSIEDIEVFIGFERQLKNRGYELFFDGGFKENYTLDEVIKTDKMLDEIIDNLKASKLSPFEQYLVIYDFLTSRKYNLNANENEATIYQSRDIISVMNSDYIVCSGYSYLMKYLCSQVGIECLEHFCFVKETHQSNFVYLKDDKYAIDGLFYSDATWDYRDSEDELKSYVFCLIPVGDVKYLKGELVTIDNCFYFYQNDDFWIYAVDLYTSANENFNIVSFLHLEEEKKLIESECASILSKNLSKIAGLKDIFKAKNVEEDVYTKISTSVPLGSSLFTIIALYILGEYELVNKSIDNILKAVERANDPDGGYAGLDYNSTMSFTFDLYGDIDEISKLDNITDYRPSEIYNLMVRYKLFRLISKKIKETKYGNIHQPIPLLAFQRALIEAYRYEGFDPKEISRMLDGAIKNSFWISHHSFNEGASNCFFTNRHAFVEQYLKYLEEHNNK